MEDDNSTVQTVEIIKRPGQSLGFYIREGNGRDRWDGVFISRLAAGSVADQNGLLRVGDEILSVNNVDVSSRRLEDVVISMSIPKRLVLTVRTQNASACSETTSSSSLSALAVEEDEPPQPPVVVVKGGRCGGGGSGSADLGSKDRTKHRSPEKQRLTNDDIERGMRPYTRSASTSSSNRCQDARAANHDGIAGGRISRHHAHQQQQQQQQLSYYFQHGGRDDSSDSGLSSENSRFFQSTEPRGPPRRCGSLGSQSDGTTELYENIRNLQNHVDEVSRQRDQFEVRNRTFGTYRSTPVQLDYSSDPDSGYPQNRLGLERLMSRYASAKGNTQNNTLSFPERLDWVKNKYDGVGNSKRKYPVEYATLGRRFSQADQYEAELDLLSAPGGASHSLSKERPLSARDRYITQLMMSTGDRCTLPPGGQYGNGLEEVPDGPNWKGWLQRGLENLSLNQINNMNSFPVPDDMAMPSNNTPNYVASLHKDLHNSDAGRNWSASPTNATSKLETVPRAIAPNHQRRLTRKMSADSLFDYKTYQMEEPVNSYMDPTADAAAAGRRAPEAGNVASKVAVSGGPGLFMPFSTMTLSRAPSRQTATVVTGSSARDHHLAKAPLQIRKEAFKHYQALPANDLEVSISGQISCHVFCGHGLVSSRAVLQDLYCVIELDALGCARTTVHTGAMNFDWDDRFEIDLYNARTMSFLIYSWDPYGRHRLSFSCVIALSTLVQQAARQRLAIKMDPKGILYTELVYRDPRSVFHRTPSVHANAFFGVGLQSIVDREKTGTNVPILVHRCIEEVEKRGLDQVGLYRLCGSAKRKQHLREELERNPWTADLSTESVGDINIITVILKDFLRELPEPLCTTALHQMLMDALSVQLPGDVEGNAMLVLTIIECWPKVNQETLATVLNHLRQVSLKADVNKMSIANLAVCFGPILLCPGSQANLPQGQTWNFSKHIELLKYILDIWPHIRDKLGKPGERQLVSRSTGHSSHLHRGANHVD